MSQKIILDKDILIFTLSLYNNPLLSRKVVDYVIQQFSNLIDNTFIPFIQHQVQTKVLDMQSRSKMQFILEESKGLFQNYSSEHNRFQLYKSFYVPPELFELGKTNVFVNTEKTAEVVEKIIYGTHIPLKKTLEVFFSIPGMFEEIMKYVNSVAENDSCYTNIMQGQLWKSIYANSNKIVFPLLLYFDELECGNPLASHAGEEKLGGIYVSLACLPPHLIAKAENIFL